MTFVWKNLAGTTLKTEANVVTSTYQTNIVDTYYVEVSNTNGTTTSNQVTLDIAYGVPPFQFADVKNTGGYAAGTGMSVSVPP